MWCRGWLLLLPIFYPSLSTNYGVSSTLRLLSPLQNVNWFLTIFLICFKMSLFTYFICFLNPVSLLGVCLSLCIKQLSSSNVLQLPLRYWGKYPPTFVFCGCSLPILQHILLYFCSRATGQSSGQAKIWPEFNLASENKGDPAEEKKMVNVKQELIIWRYSHL